MGLRKKAGSEDVVVTLENGKQVCAYVTVTYYYDSNYGADADGNRGMGVWVNDGVEFHTPKTDINGEELSQDEVEEAVELINDEADFISVEEAVEETEN